MFLDRKIWRELGRPDITVIFNNKVFIFGKTYSWDTIDEESGTMTCLILKDYVCGKKMPVTTFKGKIEILGLENG